MDQTREDIRTRSAGDAPLSARRFGAPPDAIAASVLLVLCAAAFAITTTFEKVPALIAQGMPPTHFPRLVIALIALLSIVLMGRAYRSEWPDRKPLPAMVAYTVLLVFAFALLIEWLGLVVSSVLLCFCMPLLWGERRYLLCLAFALVFPGLIYLVFAWFFGVRFPPGLLSSL